MGETGEIDVRWEREGERGEKGKGKRGEKKKRQREKRGI